MDGLQHLNHKHLHSMDLPGGHATGPQMACGFTMSDAVAMERVQESNLSVTFLGLAPP